MRWKMAALVLAFAPAIVSAESITVPPAVPDELGQAVVEKMRADVQNTRAKLNAELDALDALLLERQREIDVIQRDRDARYYTVTPNTFRAELITFAQRLGIQTIRWDESIPACADWQFDSQFRIDIRDREDALAEFFAGLPLQATLHTKDASITIRPTEVMNAPGC